MTIDLEFEERMKRKQFKKLMRYLAEQRLDTTSYLRRRPKEMRDLHHLIKEMAPGYIVHSRQIRCRDSDDPSIEYVRSIRRSLRVSTDLATDIGMLDLLADYEDLILAGMQFNDLPKEDEKALRLLGEADPSGALLAAFLSVKHRQNHRRSSDENYRSIEEQLRSIEGRLDRVIEAAEQNSDLSLGRKAEKPPRSWRWFKGLGEIAQGTALTLADCGLAAGLIVVPVAPTTQTWGAIISSITGVGTTLHGIGELRGE